MVDPRVYLFMLYVSITTRALANQAASSLGIYNNGWNIANDWTIYVCGHFAQKWTDRKTFTGHNKTLTSYGSHTSTKGKHRQGGVFKFDAEKVTSRVGISFISTDKGTFLTAACPVCT